MHRPSRSHRRLARGASLAAAIALVVAACHTGRATAGDTTRHARCASADSAGTLRVTNHSGRMLEIHSWDATGQDRVLGNASPGLSTFEVPGPAALGMRYGAYDLATARYYAIVTWIRPHGRLGGGALTMDLVCGTAP